MIGKHQIYKSYLTHPHRFPDNKLSGRVGGCLPRSKGKEDHVMYCFNAPMIVSHSLMNFGSLHAFSTRLYSPSIPNTTVYKSSKSPSINSGLREIRDRMKAVENTQKITEAMKLVSAAKIRRAQEAVLNSRPFAESLAEFLYVINEQIQFEDVDVPLTKIRPVKKAAIVVITGNKGLCGGHNSSILKKAEERIREFNRIGLDYTVISVGKKGNSYFRRRDDILVDRFVEVSSFPTAKEAQTIADYVYSVFVTEEVDKVELVYCKFVSLVQSKPVIHTLLPISAKGELCDANGTCVDASEDEFFRLTSKDGKLAVERDKMRRSGENYCLNMQFEQDPVQIFDAILPLYMNSQILKALQESLASELASRMNAMTNATDNAIELKKKLSTVYNRTRQAKITNEILEIITGADALK